MVETNQFFLRMNSLNSKNTIFKWGSKENTVLLLKQMVYPVDENGLNELDDLKGNL